MKNNTWRVKFTPAVVIALLISASLPSRLEVKGQGIPSSYQYLTLDGKGNGQIVSIDPETKTSTIKPFEVQASSSIPFTAWVSPSKEWVMFDYWPATDPNPMQLVLLNTFSGKVKVLDTPTKQFSDPEPNQAIAWSPDNRFAAMPLLQGNQTQVALFSAQDGNINLISSGRVTPIRFSWSNNSVWLAILGYLPPETKRTGTFEIVNTQTGKIMEAPESFDTGDPVEGVCSFFWSPDNRYIAFINNCYFSATDGSSEIVLWDLKTNKMVAITSLSSQIFSSIPHIAEYTQYTLNWLSPTQLVIGEWIKYQTVTEIKQISQTLLYNPQTATTSTLFSGQAREVAVKPITNRLAISLVSDYDPRMGTARNAQTRLESIQIGSSAVSVDSTVSLPAGTNLSWSPDGKMLAYQQTGTNNFIFVTDGSPPAVTYTFSDSSVAADPASKTAYILPIGWVGGNSAIAGTPSPTIQVSPTATPNGASVPGSNQIGG